MFQQNLLTWKTLASINQSTSGKNTVTDRCEEGYLCHKVYVFREKTGFCEQPEAQLDKYHDNSVLDAEIWHWWWIMAQYCHISAGSDNYEARSSKNILTLDNLERGMSRNCFSLSQSQNVSDMAEYVLADFPLMGGTECWLCYHCLRLTKPILNTMSQAPPLID